MVMEASDLLAHGTTGGVSALGAGWLVKWLFKNWVKNHDDTLKELVRSVQSLQITMAKIEVMAARFELVDQKATALDKSVAVLQHRVDDTEKNLNGLGGKVRTMESQ